MTLKRRLFILNLLMFFVPIMSMLVFVVIGLVILAANNHDFIDMLSHPGGQIIFERSVFIYLIVVMFVSLMLSVLVGVFYGTYMSKSVIKPLKELQIAMDRMKNDDLNYEFIASDDKEIINLNKSYEALRLRLKKKEAENIAFAREQKTLLANISHDLKTPITSIKGYAQGILDGVSDTEEKRERYLKTILIKSDSMNNMLENLSLYSKLELKTMPYKMEQIEIDKFCESVYSEHLLDMQNANMEFEIDKGASGIVTRMDSDKMHRAFANIIGNSIKYKNGDSGSLKITTSDENSGVVISFEDKGIGISAQDLPHVFDSFYRSDPSRTSNIKGNGLGLSIVKRIVVSHGGKIWLRSSSENGGCTVSIYLPIYESK